MTGVPAGDSLARHAADHAGHGYANGGEAERTKGDAMVSETEILDLEQPHFVQAREKGYWYERFSKKALFFGQVLLFGVVIVQFVMLYRSYALAAVAAADLVDAGVVRRQSASAAASSATSNVPDYYVTKPELLPGEWEIVIKGKAD